MKWSAPFVEHTVHGLLAARGEQKIKFLSTLL